MTSCNLIGRSCYAVRLPIIGDLNREGDNVRSWEPPRGQWA